MVDTATAINAARLFIPLFNKLFKLFSSERLQIKVKGGSIYLTNLGDKSIVVTDVQAYSYLHNNWLSINQLNKADEGHVPFINDEVSISPGSTLSIKLGGWASQWSLICGNYIIPFRIQTVNFLYKPYLIVSPSRLNKVASLFNFYLIRLPK